MFCNQTHFLLMVKTKQKVLAILNQPSGITLICLNFCVFWTSIILNNIYRSIFTTLNLNNLKNCLKISSKKVILIYIFERKKTHMIPSSQTSLLVCTLLPKLLGNFNKSWQKSSKGLNSYLVPKVDTTHRKDIQIKVSTLVKAVQSNTRVAVFQKTSKTIKCCACYRTLT